MKQLLKKYWRELAYERDDKRRHTGKAIKIVAIGGGTGLSTLLRGIKEYSDNISAIVSMADNGGSTGKLRDEFDIPPPGDIRKCIAALAYDEKLISDIFNFRFKKKSNSLSGHTLGNVWLTALTQYYGSFDRAVETTSEIFFTSGQILPVTLDEAELVATYQDNTKITGENNLPQTGKKIKKVEYDREVKAYPKTVKVIENADIIILGPGSLYTSIIPNIILKDVSRAIENNKLALKIYIANCSTERGETEEYNVRDHIRAIRDHAGYDLFNFCLVNNRIIREAKDQAELGNVNNITTTKESIDGCKVVKADLVDNKKPLYHDHLKLSEKIIEIYNNQT
jgi:uncharacterized cofD-like protein